MNKKTTIGDVEISTVSLPAICICNDLKYETVIFGGSLGGQSRKYKTSESALDGHAAWVQRVKEIVGSDE